MGKRILVIGGIVLTTLCILMSTIFTWKTYTLVEKPKSLGVSISNGTVEADNANIYNNIRFGGTLIQNGISILDANSGMTANTSTLGYTPNQLNVTSVAFSGGGTTTIVSVLNSSGSDRVISKVALDITGGSSAVITNTNWSGYTSVLRASVTKAVNLIEGTIASSTANQVLGSTTTLMAMWPTGTYYNVTTTAANSSTGNAVIYWHGF